MRGDPNRREEGAERPQGGLDLSSFLGTSSRELMHLLLAGDPLGLEARSIARRDELAYLVASERMLFRSAARTAYCACVFGVTMPLDSWLGKCIDDGISGILKDEQADHRDRVPVEEDEERYYHAVTDLLDVSVEEARRVCIRFNRLAFEERAAYFKFSLERTLLEQAKDSSGQGRTLCEDLARALRAVLSGEGSE